VDAKPVGWASIAPRPEFERVSGDPVAAADGAPGAPVWSIVCFYIHRWAAVPHVSDDPPPVLRREPGRPVMQLELGSPGENR
jgi:hypothetical protein